MSFGDGLVILLRQQANIEVLILGCKGFIINPSLQIGHFHNVLLLVQQSTVEQGHQKNYNGNDGHSAADYHRCGGNAAALRFPFLFLLFAALLGPADGVILPAGRIQRRHTGDLPVLLHGSMLPDPAAFHRAFSGFGLNLLFRSG